MERHRLLEAFRSAAVEVLSIDEDAVTESACLGEDLGANSLDLVEVVLILEQNLALSVADEALVNVHAVADVLDVVLAAQPTTSSAIDDATTPTSSYWSSTGYL